MGKKILGILIPGIIVLLLLTGWGRKTKEVSRVTLRFANWEVTPEQLRLWSEVVKKFNQTHPGIRIKFDMVSGGTQPIIVQIAGGRAPDIFFWDTHIVAPLIEKKAVLDLTPFIKKDKIDPQKFFPSAWQGAIFEGKIYGMPPYWGASAIAYNKDLFDKAGIPYPSGDWTWDDYLSLAQKLTIREDGRTIQFGATPPDVYTLLLSMGEAWFDKKGTFTGDTPGVKKALSYIQDMRYKYKVSPSMSQLGPVEQAYRSEMELFMTGKLGMFVASSWTLPVLKKIKGFSWDIAPLPRVKGGKRRVEEGAALLVISSQTRYPQEAWEFVKFVTYGEGAEILARGGNCIPALKEVAEKYFNPPPENIKVFYNQIEEVAFSPARFTWYTEWRQQILKPELDKLLLNMQTPEEMIENLKKKTERFFSNK